MNISDRFYCAQNGVPVVASQRLFERIPFDNGIGLSITVVSSNGAAASTGMKMYGTNMDPTYSPPQIDANAVVNMNNFYTGSLGVNASTTLAWTIYSQPVLASRWLFFDVNFTAPGNYWLYVAIRRQNIP